jgi:hypothetical protein
MKPYPCGHTRNDANTLLKKRVDKYRYRRSLARICKTCERLRVAKARAKFKEAHGMSYTAYWRLYGSNRESKINASTTTDGKRRAIA